jgi:hypothetical protein
VVYRVLDPPPELAVILDACVEHRRGCPDIRTK